MNTEIDSNRINQILADASKCVVQQSKVEYAVNKTFRRPILKKWAKSDLVVEQVNEKWFAIVFTIPGEAVKSLPKLIGLVDAICARKKWRRHVFFKRFNNDSKSEKMARHGYYSFWIHSVVFAVPKPVEVP